MMRAISTPTQFVGVATQIFAVCKQTSKTAKIMRLEILALYGIYICECVMSTLTVTCILWVSCIGSNTYVHVHVARRLPYPTVIY